MGSLLLIRHGQASFGAADYDQLSEVGRRQSALLGGWLSRIGVPADTVAMGSQRRHRQTAEACLSAMGVEPAAQSGWVVDAGFDEYDHEQILHRYRPEFADRTVLTEFLSKQDNPRRVFQQMFSEAIARWMAGANDAEYNESWRAFRGRCEQALVRLTEQAGASQTVLLFTSGGPIAALCQSLLDIPDARIFDLNWTLANTGVTRLLHRPGQTSLHSLNNVAHLEVVDSKLITYR